MAISFLFYRVIKITDDGNEVVYQIPTLDYIFKIFKVFLFVGVAVFAVVTMIQVTVERMRSK